MFSQGAKAYQEIGVHTAVTTASPIQIVVLLYEGAMSAIMSAKGEIERRNVVAKAKLIIKAIDILDGLRSALDVEKGGDISHSLNDLYQYMTQRLSMANLNNDPAILDEVHGLLAELLSAWATIAENSTANKPSPSP